MFIPIRTETPIRRPPTANLTLLGLNVATFLVVNQQFLGEHLSGFAEEHFILTSGAPALHQFVTYQFLHGDAWHLLANMLFLWVFGNSVNAKMGQIPYVLFYLAGGIFAAWAYAATQARDFQLVGASGAIASVTTAYLALFPRSRVTMLIVFFFIQFVELPALLIIGLKIILWDNIIAPGLHGGGNVAYGAHLAGYLFGFVSAMLMLGIGALPHDQFDMLALWRRWRWRRSFSTAYGTGDRLRYGTVARPAATGSPGREAEETRLDHVSELRGRISVRLEAGEVGAAADLYGELLALDPEQCLAERQQLLVARHFYTTGRYPQAARAFERLIGCYPGYAEVEDIRLLLGIIYARDLQQYEAADRHLSESLRRLTGETRREQCLRWLREVRAALGKPAPES
jgi:membrane associated rhomboid family serine protease